MKEIEINKDSNRIVGTRYALLSDIATLSSLKNKQEDNKKEEVVFSAKSSVSTDEYLKNLFELTNLKPKEIVIISKTQAEPEEKPVTKSSSFLGDANCAVGYSDIMTNRTASANLKWSN